MTDLEPGDLAHGLDTAALSPLQSYLRPRRFRAGHVLWTEGEVDGRLVVLDRGRVKILRVRPNGGSTLLYLFGPGTVFGFLPFLDGGAYPATAVALDDIKARTMSRSSLRQAVQDDPQVSLVLLQALGTRLRQAFTRIDELGQRGAVPRVAAAVAALLPAGSTVADLPIVELPGPAHVFAQEIGVQPETFSRTLSRLVDRGILHRLGPGRVQVLEPERLVRIAAGRDDDPSREVPAPS